MPKRSFSRARISGDGIVNVRMTDNEFMASNSKLLLFLAFIMILAFTLEYWLRNVAYSWALIGATMWITSLHAKQQRRGEIDQLRRQLSSYWEQQELKNKAVTGKEATEWLSKLLCKLWPNVGEPRLLMQLQLLAEKNSRSDKLQGIRAVDLETAALGNAAPELGLGRTFWSIDPAGQEVLHTGLKWDSNGLHIRLSMHLGASYFSEMVDIIVSSVQIQGDLRILPILDGYGLLYSFGSLPDVNISMALSSNTHRLPTDATGIQSWLENLLSDSLYQTTGSPGHRLWTLLPVNLNKTCIGGYFTLEVVSASNLSRPSPKPITVEKPREDLEVDRVLGPTFVDISFEGVQRETRVSVLKGRNPEWGDSLNLTSHDSEGLLQLAIYERKDDGMVCEFIGSCNIKVKYGEDDSVFYWAVSSEEKVVAGRGERPGVPVTLTVPLQQTASGTITVQLTLEEWIFARDSPQTDLVSTKTKIPGPYGKLWPPVRALTGLTLRITVLEGRDLAEIGSKPSVKPYLKVQYGKNSRRTRAVGDRNPVWREDFNFAELLGETWLKISCYDAATWQHRSLGTARINPHGLLEGSPKELRLPLENAERGEIWIRAEVGKWERETAGTRLQENANAIVPFTNNVVSNGKSEEDTTEKLRLVVVEARKLKSADRSGDLDAYVSIRYGTIKRKTKVVQRSQLPQWNQVFEFSLSPGPLLLHVKDHRSVLSTQSIGHVEINPRSLTPNQTEDRWHSLKEIDGGELRLQVTLIQPGSKNTVLQQPTTEPRATINKLEGTTQKLRHLVEQVIATVEDKESGEVQQLIEDVTFHEDERESLIANLQKDRELLILKVKQLEEAVTELL